MDDGLMDIQGLQLLGANRRVSKQKLVEVSETVGWTGFGKRETTTFEKIEDK